LTGEVLLIVSQRAKAGTHRDEAGRRADQPGEEQRPAPNAIDIEHGDERDKMLTAPIDHVVAAV
jgi:hypothetical protein